MDPQTLYWHIRKLYTIQQVGTEWVKFIRFLCVAQPKVVLEIGSHTGGSGYTLSFFADVVIMIDNNNVFKNSKPISENCRLFFINKSSKNRRTMPKIKKILTSYDNQVDLLFLDGDHTRGGAEEDFRRYAPLVRSGGHIVLHDIKETTYHKQQNCLVYKFWNKLKEKYPNAIEIIGDKKWGGIGIIQV
jgi:cephalosporin hydroxylase